MPWSLHSPQMANLTASLFPWAMAEFSSIPPPFPSTGKAPAVPPREHAVRHSMKQLQIIKGLNGVLGKSRELATSINSLPCRAA